MVVKATNDNGNGYYCSLSISHAHKHRDLSATVPPCPTDFNESTESESGERASTGAARTQTERLITVCRDFSTAYQELQEKYHDIIYSMAEKLLKNSQANQMKQLKTCLEKETSDVMRQLNLIRRSEVKALSLVHKDRDELVRYNAIYLNGVKNDFTFCLLFAAQCTVHTYIP